MALAGPRQVQCNKIKLMRNLRDLANICNRLGQVFINTLVEHSGY